MKRGPSGIRTLDPPFPAELESAVRGSRIFGDAFWRAQGTVQARYLAGARALIDEAVRMSKAEAVDCGGCAPPVLTGGPRFTRTR